MNDYAATWKAFDSDWDKTCAYHREQAIKISSAVTDQLFTPEEAMSELRLIAEERHKCKECGR